MIDSKGEIITTNRSVSEILGYATDMLEGKGWGEIFFDTDNNVEFNQVIVDVIQEKKINLHRDTSYVRPTGETLQLSITTSFLRENGEIVGISEQDKPYIFDPFFSTKAMGVSNIGAR